MPVPGDLRPIPLSSATAFHPNRRLIFPRPCIGRPSYYEATLRLRTPCNACKPQSICRKH